MPMKINKNSTSEKKMKEQLDMCCMSTIGYLTVTEEKDTYPTKQKQM